VRINRRLLVLTSTILILESFLASVLTPLIPFYRRELGLSEGASGILVAAYAAGLLMASLPSGWVSSVFNPRKAVVTGLIGISASTIAFGFADEIAALDISRFFMGAFGALMWAGSVSWMVSATERDRRGQVMGTLLAAAVAGELIGAPIGALAERVGTDRVFTIVVLVAIALAVFALRTPAVAEVDGQTARQALTMVRRTGVASWIFALSAVIAPSIALGLVLLVAPLRLETFGLTVWVIAGVFLTMSFVEMVTGPLVGSLSDRIGRHRPYYVGVSIMALCVIAVSAVGSSWLAVAVLIVYSIGSAFAFTTSMTLVADLATGSGLNQGYSSALSGMGWAGGLIIGAALGGQLVESFGFIVASVIAVVLLTIAAAAAARVRTPSNVS
jgi:MFS family permease